MNVQARLISILSILLLSASASATDEKTGWGVPNLQGVWDFRTLTPMERPEAFGDKAVLTQEEAAALLNAIRPPDQG